MTGQIHDQVSLRGQTYALLSVAGAGLFEPTAFGLVPTMLHTACWRGFYCAYAVEASDLLLTTLTIRTLDGKYPPLNGVFPADDDYGTRCYTNLRLPLKFGGELLLGAGFRQEQYVHMGFQSPAVYQEVQEATFLDGKLVSVRDRSGDFSQNPPVKPPSRL
jgi:hypothetical protein